MSALVRTCQCHSEWLANICDSLMSQPVRGTFTQQWLTTIPTMWDWHCVPFPTSFILLCYVNESWTCPCPRVVLVESNKQAGLVTRRNQDSSVTRGSPYVPLKYSFSLRTMGFTSNSTSKRSILTVLLSRTDLVLTPKKVSTLRCGYHIFPLCPPSFAHWLPSQTHWGSVEYIKVPGVHGS